MQLQTKRRRLLCKGASPHCARQLLATRCYCARQLTHLLRFHPGCLPATTPSTFITPPIFTLSYVHLPVTSVPAAASVKASHPTIVFLFHFPTQNLQQYPIILHGPPIELSVIHISQFCYNSFNCPHMHKSCEKPNIYAPFSHREGGGSIGRVFCDLTIVLGPNLWICEEYYHNGRYLYITEATQRERTPTALLADYPVLVFFLCMFTCKNPNVNTLSWVINFPAPGLGLQKSKFICFHMLQHIRYGDPA